MRRSWIFLPALIASLVATPAHAYGQSNDPANDSAQQAAAQRDLQEQKEKAERERGQAELRAFLHDTGQPRRSSPGGIEAQFFEFRQAVPKFRTATDDMRATLGLDGKLGKSLKNIQAQADVMLRYLNTSKVKHPGQDPEEFKDYSQAELQWETLNVAETISAYLDYAVAIEHQDVVAKKNLDFLYKLDGALLRLKWLTAHAK